MTVSSTELKTILIASGETSFSYWFSVESITDVKVYFNIAGVDVLQEGYTVDSLDLEAGGNVIFDTAPDVGTKITIIRETSRTQDTNYVENDPFPAEAHESALDKLTHIVQEQDEKMSRCLRYPLSDIVQMSADLPELESRKNKFIYFNQDGVIRPAEGQLIETTHTHTTLDNLIISGVFTSEYIANLNYLYCGGAEFSAAVSMASSLYVSADLTSDGYISTTMDMSCVNITATSGIFTGATIGTLYATNLFTDTISIDNNLDIPGYLTVGNAGLKLYQTSYVSILSAETAGSDTCASIRLDAEDSTALGGGQYTYLETGYDDLYGHKVDMEESFVFGKNFRATDIDYIYPTFYGDAKNILAAGNEMEFHILSLGRDAEDTDPYGFTWHTGDYTMTSGTTLMTLTESGILTVASGIYVGATEVSMDGHTHDDRYYTESEVDNLFYTRSETDAISGTLHAEIVSVSGILQDQLDGLSIDHGTLSGILDDDHTQYLLRTDFTTASGNIVSQIPSVSGYMPLNLSADTTINLQNRTLTMSGTAGKKSIETSSLGTNLYSNGVKVFSTSSTGGTFYYDSKLLYVSPNSVYSDVGTGSSMYFNPAGGVMFSNLTTGVGINDSVISNIATLNGASPGNLITVNDNLLVNGYFQTETIQAEGPVVINHPTTPGFQALYFGDPTTSGTWRFIVESGVMKLQQTTGGLYNTITSWSGVA